MALAILLNQGEQGMLKITEHRIEGTDSTELLLEGRLVGPWVEEVDSFWRRMDGNRQKQTVIDLGGVTFVDAEGKGLLTRMWRAGAKFHAAGCLMRCLVDEITETGTNESTCLHDKKIS
ncbi:MAG: hypothetical protein GDA67_09285 [Nitrospira sp. CR1.3]|nr:hypothetical protein [Nitrospira sp. CR1.3]